jgi:hypothetical protein
MRNTKLLFALSLVALVGTALAVERVVVLEDAYDDK